MRKLLLTSLLIFSLIGNCFAAGNDPNTVSLLHMDGTDASTTFTDDAAGGTHTWTAVGNAQIDTAQSKFGGASGLFDGTGDYLTAPDNADWAFGTGDFTVDCWVKLNDLTRYHPIIAQYVDDNNYMIFTLYTTLTTGLTEMQLYVVSGGVAIINVNKGLSIAPNTWTHCAFVRSGNNFMYFQDGVQQGTTVTDTDSMPDYASVLYGGYSPTTSALKGWMDEVRISKGIARWTANFTPPTAAYDDIPAAVPSSQVILIE